jgi:ankyrin repeat protein
MKARLLLFLAISLVVAATPLFGQQSVCALFSHLDDLDGQQVRVAGELIISKDLAVLGSADCDNQYIFREQVWPTALSLRPSAAVTPAQLREFQKAGLEADSLRHAGKTVSASASFSGRIRLAESGDFPAELTFDSMENLKTEALPDVSTLTVIPICDLFQHLPAWKGKRIAVRGEYVSTMEGAWIVGACKGTFVTDGYRWPVALAYGSPAYFSQAMAKLYDANWPSPSESGPSRETPFINKTATFVGRLRMRSEYSVSCQPDGRYIGNGFGHLNGAAAELLVEGMRNVEIRERSDTKYAANDASAQRCTPPDPATLCLKAESLARAAATGCTERVREFLAKDGIDSKKGGESMALRAAIHSGNESVVKLLLNAGAPLDPVETTRSPLAEAAISWQVGIVKLLIASGAKVDSLDRHGISFLDESHVFDPTLLKVLLEAGAEVNATDAFGETALMKASGYGYEQIIKVLIEHGADLNVRDKKGRTAVMHAAASCCSHAIPLLLENGADPDARDREGKTALDLADASNNLAAIAILSVTTKTSH